MQEKKGDEIEKKNEERKKNYLYIKLYKQNNCISTKREKKRVS